MRLLTAGLQVRVLPEEPCGAANLVICPLIPRPKRARFSRRRATSRMRPPSLPLGLGSSRAGVSPKLGSAPWARALPLRQDLIPPGRLVSDRFGCRACADHRNNPCRSDELCFSAVRVPSGSMGDIGSRGCRRRGHVRSRFVALGAVKTAAPSASDRQDAFDRSSLALESGLRARRER